MDWKKKDSLNITKGGLAEAAECPFCGESVIVLSGDKDFGLVKIVHGNPYRPTSCKVNPALAGYMPDELAVEIWNTRPLEDALRAELAAAQAEVERLRELLKQRVMGNWEDGAK